jgi:hypothetical protein
VKKGHVSSGEAGRQKCERKEINGDRSYLKNVWNGMEIRHIYCHVKLEYRSIRKSETYNVGAVRSVLTI